MTPEEIAFAHKQLRGPLCGSVCQNGALAIDTILEENASLKEQVVTLEKLQGVALIESLRAEAAERREDHMKLVEENHELRQQLAASQLEAKRLRDTMQKIAGHPEETPPFYWWQIYARNALSSPTSTEALDAYVAEKVKESHKVIPREGLVPHAYQLEATHNNAEYWYKWGHSAEAKEKGEQVICMAQAVFAWRNAAYAKAEEVSALIKQRDLAVEFIANVSTSPKLSGSGWQEQANMTLAAIKESET